MKESIYTKLNDEELIEAWRDGDEAAMNALLIRYKPLVRRRAKTMFLIGGDSEDLIQEGMIGLYQAMGDYNEERDSRFRIFADICVSRKMYTAIEASQRQKNIPLNSYISLYEEIPGDNENKITLQEILTREDDRTPEEILVDSDDVKRLQKILEKELSDFEKDVLNLHLAGHGYVQVADLLEKSPKSIDNALQRIKTKVRDAYSSMISNDR